jgi:hypothetical protein
VNQRTFLGALAGSLLTAPERGPFIGVGFYPTPYYPAPYYVYAAPPCYWQPAYWVNQPYGDGWGRFTYVLQWIPAPYVCY